MQMFDVRVVRRSRLALAVALAPMAVAAAFARSAFEGSTALAAALAWLGLAALLYVWQRKPFASERPARVRVDPRGLLVGDHLAIAREHVRGGWVQPRGADRPVVHVCRSGWRSDVELAVTDVEQGRAMLRVVAADPSRTAAAFWAMARPLADPVAHVGLIVVAAAAVALGIILGQVTPAALALAVLAVIALFMGASVPTRVVIGADGVLLRWLGTARFVAWSSVSGMVSYDGGVALALEGRRWLTLRTPLGHERYHPERDAMVERLRAAWSAHREARSDEAAVKLLRRVGGQTREWIRGLRAMAATGSGYRAAALARERLWGVVEDQRADRTARAGAALALAPRLDEAGRSRLRLAASACAEPRLRFALTTAATSTGAGGLDDELAAALDAVEGECDGVGGATLGSAARG